MDADRFDSLARALRVTPARREVLVGVLLASCGHIVWTAAAISKKKKPCPPCKGRKKGKCKATLPDGTPCEAGTCQAGQCVNSPVSPPPPLPPSPPAPGCGQGGPCLVFLSSTRHFPDFGGLNDGDAICQGLASAAGLPGTYMAWLSDFDTSAKTRFAPSPGPYQLVNGTIIATSFADLVDGMLRAPISVTERGTVSDATAVWTGTDTSGTAIGDLFCDNWTEASPEFNTMVGRADSTGSAWTAALFESCLTFSAHLYCFQQR